MPIQLDGLVGGEGVVEEEALDLGVVLAPPVGPGEEGLVDEDTAAVLVDRLEAGAADDLAVPVGDDQRAARRERVGEEPFDLLRRSAIGLRMLRPDQRIVGDGDERVAVGGLERAQSKTRARKVGWRSKSTARSSHATGLPV